MGTAIVPTAQSGKTGKIITVRDAARGRCQTNSKLCPPGAHRPIRISA